MNAPRNQEIDYDLLWVTSLIAPFGPIRTQWTRLNHVPFTMSQIISLLTFAAATVAAKAAESNRRSCWCCSGIWSRLLTVSTLEHFTRFNDGVQWGLVAALMKQLLNQLIIGRCINSWFGNWRGFCRVYDHIRKKRQRQPQAISQEIKFKAYWSATLFGVVVTTGSMLICMY